MTLLTKRFLPCSTFLQCQQALVKDYVPYNGPICNTKSSDHGLHNCCCRHHACLCLRRAEDASDFPNKELEPLLASTGERSLRAGSFRGADPHPPANASCSQLQVRSRLFSTSEDAQLAAHPQLLASSPTNPFDTAEILGSDSIPSSPFGDSISNEWLHVHEGLLERSADTHSLVHSRSCRCSRSALLSWTDDVSVAAVGSAPWHTVVRLPCPCHHVLLVLASPAGRSSGLRAH